METIVNKVLFTALSHQKEVKISTYKGTYTISIELGAWIRHEALTAFLNDIASIESEMIESRVLQSETVPENYSYLKYELKIRNKK